MAKTSLKVIKKMFTRKIEKVKDKQKKEKEKKKRGKKLNESKKARNLEKNN